MNVQYCIIHNINSLSFSFFVTSNSYSNESLTFLHHLYTTNLDIPGNNRSKVLLKTIYNLQPHVVYFWKFIAKNENYQICTKKSVY